LFYENNSINKKTVILKTSLKVFAIFQLLHFLERENTGAAQIESTNISFYSFFSFGIPISGYHLTFLEAKL
jgi:hypothetical protein